MLSRLLPFLCLVLFAMYGGLPAIAADSILAPGPHITGQRWSAFWIASPQGPARDYGVFHFRKTFTLPDRPERFIIHVSADNRYRLFVNGHVVHAGPERGDVRHWRFDTLDIAAQMRAGENVLAVQVWNYGADAPVAQLSVQTGLVVQGDGARESVVNTGRSWRAFANPAYTPIADFFERLNTYIVVGPGDDVDGARHPWGWEQPGFDDRAWLAAKILRPGEPRGTSTDGKWLLVPRTLPAMETRRVRLQRIRRAENVEVPPEFPPGGTPIQIPAGTTGRILFDQNELTTAFPELLVSGGRGARITLTYAESLYEGPLAAMSRLKGHRDEIEGKHIRGFEDVFRPDGGAQRLFRPLQWRTYRYVELAFVTGDDPLILHDFSGEFTAYPLVERASFASSDPVLARIWDVSWRTLRLCSHENFMDTPYYEQLSYVGDARIEALISLYVDGDDRLMRKTIECFDESREANGLTGSRYPDARHQFIPPYSLIWISMVHDYWQLRDDPAFVRQMLPGVREVLRYFEENSDPETGSYTGLAWWNFVDWVEAWRANPRGDPPRDAHGSSAILDLQVVYTLQQARDLFAAFGFPSDAERCAQRARRLREHVLTQCWDESRGLVADTSEKKTFSQHANTFLILTAEPDATSLREVAMRIVDDASLTPASLYFTFYTHRAVARAGLGGRFVTLLDPWRRLLDQGLTTLPETPSPMTRSDSHAWGAHPILDMLAVVCGIAPGSPGFKSVRIAPQLGPLTFARGSMAHPLGMIVVDLKRTGDNGVQGEVTLPAGLTGEFVWDGKSIPLAPGAQSVAF